MMASATLHCMQDVTLMDYHGEMNAEMVTKWCDEKLIPNLKEPSPIIIP